MPIPTFTSLLTTATQPVTGFLDVGPVAVPSNAKILGMQWNVANQTAGTSAMSATVQVSFDGGTTYQQFIQAGRQITNDGATVAQFWSGVNNNGNMMMKGRLTINNAITTITTSAELMFA